MKIPKKYKEKQKKDQEEAKRRAILKREALLYSYSPQWMVFEELISLIDRRNYPGDIKMLVTKPLASPATAGLSDVSLRMQYLKNNDKIPQIYYVGKGKSGSVSISTGFDFTCAHWHGEGHFESHYNTSLLSENKICLYDLIVYTGKAYNFKPLIIESHREPVARDISWISQQLSNENKTESYSEFVGRLPKHSTHQSTLSHRYNSLGYSLIRWKRYFDVDLIKEFDKDKNYFFKELEDVKLLFLKLEDSKNWTSIFEKIGYNYRYSEENSSRNKPIAKVYQKVLDNFNLPVEKLESIYDNEIIKALYSKKEIDSFIERWKE